jgi:hypothetical protein
MPSSTSQAHQLNFDGLHQCPTAVGQAQAFGAAILRILGATDVPAWHN